MENEIIVNIVKINSGFIFLGKQYKNTNIRLYTIIIIGILVQSREIRKNLILRHLEITINKKPKWCEPNITQPKW